MLIIKLKSNHLILMSLTIILTYENTKLFHRSTKFSLYEPFQYQHVIFTRSLQTISGLTRGLAINVVQFLFLNVGYYFVIL